MNQFVFVIPKYSKLLRMILEMIYKSTINAIDIASELLCRSIAFYSADVADVKGETLRHRGSPESHCRKRKGQNAIILLCSSHMCKLPMFDM